MVRAKMWKDGRDFYTQALGVLHKASKYPKSDEKPGASDHDLGLETEAESDIQQEKSVEEACYVNRALCNLELSKTSLPTEYHQKLEFISPRTTVCLTKPLHRKLPIYNPRLRSCPPAQPLQHQSLLPLLSRPPRPRQDSRSHRCLHPRRDPRSPQRVLFKTAVQNPLP